MGSFTRILHSTDRHMPGRVHISTQIFFYLSHSWWETMPLIFTRYWSNEYKIFNTAKSFEINFLCSHSSLSLEYWARPLQREQTYVQQCAKLWGCLFLRCRMVRPSLEILVFLSYLRCVDVQWEDIVLKFQPLGGKGILTYFKTRRALRKPVASHEKRHTRK